MARYRKKPVVIEAFEITYHEMGNIQQLDGVAVEDDDTTGEVYISIETLEGTMRGNIGDYLIRGVSNELYPCKPEIFEATYESVEAGA